MNSKIYLRSALFSGVCTGLTCFASVLFFYQIGMKPLGRHFFLFMPIFLTGIVLGISYYRNYKNNGEIEGAKSVIMGLIINFVAAACYASTIYIYLQYIDTTLLTQHHKDLLELLATNKQVMIEQTTQQVYEEKLQSIQTITPANIALDVWLKTVGIGFFIALLAGLLLRYRKTV